MIKKILILRLSSMGDILLATPIIDILKSKFKDCHIDWVVKRSFKEVLSNNPHIHHIYYFSTISEFQEIRRKISNNHYDYIFDLHQTFKTFLIKKLFDKKKVFSYEKRLIERFLLVHLKRPYTKIYPVTILYLSVLKKAKLLKDYPAAWNLSFFISKKVEEQTIQMNRLLDESYIVVAPGASYPTKMWPKENFRELIKRYNRKVILLGNGVIEERICDYIAKGFDFCLNLSGKLSLEATATVIRYSELMICNDSGLLHIAECFKKPVIAFFGCTTEELGFFPYSTQHYIFENKKLPCRPCTHFGKRKCPKKHFLCMRSILVDGVTEKLMEMKQ